MRVCFYIWGALGLLITLAFGMQLTLSPSPLTIAWLTYCVACELFWITGLLFFGIGAMLPPKAARAAGSPGFWTAPPGPIKPPEFLAKPASPQQTSATASTADKDSTGVWMLVAGLAIAALIFLVKFA